MFELKTRQATWAVLSLVWLVVLSATSVPAVGQDKPRVAVITTGGTIAQKIDPKTGQAVPTLGADQLLESVPGLKGIADIVVTEVANIDSRDMQPSQWLAIARAVAKAAADPAIAGVVVVHGTDTMEDTGYFLELTRHTDKPIVLTGSMRDASSPWPDGPLNLLNAVRQAADPRSAGRGVTLTLNGRIIAANAARKVDAGNIDTFDGGAWGWLGTVEGNKVYWRARPDRGQSFDLPGALPSVPVVMDYPGSTGALLDAAVANKAAGVVVVGYGIGNVSHPMYDAIARARAKGVPILVTSRVNRGQIRPAYGGEGGGASLQKLGAILSPINDPGKARIALMLALAEKAARDPAALTARLQRAGP
ncbi:asparaginase [Methylocystis sp.]|uniref:asparaginase n=1 Tax=Methylocystis sp. TaxID=1911079 RepID=UPI003D0AF60B